MPNLTIATALAAGFLAWTAAPALATMAPRWASEGLTAPAAPDEELANLRGGFQFGGGILLGFAIDARTEVGGVMARQWSFNAGQGALSPATLTAANVSGSFANLFGTLNLIGNAADAAVIRNLLAVRLDVSLSAAMRNRVDHGLARATLPFGMR